MREKYRKVTINGRQVREHIAVAERALGRKLPPGAVVHHMDENPRNNDPSNLVICPSQAYHIELHARMRAMAATGDPDQRPCRRCKQHDQVGNLERIEGKNAKGYSLVAFEHGQCRRDYSTKMRASKLKIAPECSNPG
jgi:HNH endonuclease